MTVRGRVGVGIVVGVTLGSTRMDVGVYVGTEVSMGVGGGVGEEQAATNAKATSPRRMRKGGRCLFISSFPVECYQVPGGSIRS